MNLLILDFKTSSFKCARNTLRRTEHTGDIPISKKHSSSGRLYVHVHAVPLPRLCVTGSVASDYYYLDSSRTSRAGPRAAENPHYYDTYYRYHTIIICMIWSELGSANGF